MAMTKTNSNARYTNPSSGNQGNAQHRNNKPWKASKQNNDKRSSNGNKKTNNSEKNFKSQKNRKPAPKDPNDRSAIGLPNKSPARFRTSLMTQSRISSHIKLDDRIAILANEGWDTSFGTIGKHTTWCLLEKDGHEIIGYTYVEKLESFDPERGKARALTQALARKSLQDNEKLLLTQKKAAAKAN